MTEEETNQTSVAQRGITRRSMLVGSAGMAGLGAAFLAACTTSSSSSSSGPQASTVVGKSRHVIWVTHNVSEWNVLVGAGFMDATKILGWTYSTFGNAGAFDVAKTVNDQIKAIALKPDVLVTTWTDPAAFHAPLKQALDAGIHVVLNNTNQADEGNDLGLPYVGQSFLGAGTLLGMRMAAAIQKGGRTSGVIPDGNPEPGHVALETRHAGFAAGLAKYNSANGTSFTTENFADQSHDLPTSVPLWKAKISQLGSRFAGSSGTGFTAGVAALQAQKELNFPPGKYPIGSFDTTPELNQGIKDGFVSVLIDQQLYSQGFVPVVLAWQSLERSFFPPQIYDCGSTAVDAANIAKIAARDDLVLKLGKQYGLTK